MVGALTEPEVVRLAAGAERHSSIRSGWRSRRLADPDQPPEVGDFTAEPGLGALATVDGRQVVIGNAKLMDRHGIALPDPAATALAEAEAEGQTAVLVAVDEAVVAVLGLADTIRESAAGAVAELRRLGLSHGAADR